MTIEHRCLVFLTAFALLLTTAGCTNQQDAPLTEDETLSSESSTTVLGLRVGASSSGKSIARIGANGGGSALPTMADLRDLGITTYRLWGGMQTFEPVDDDGVFG
ncbi:MAG: hypothetical protein M3511_06490, partial [Deinococcota bacterium]|nr:hypothetical protein [Deinococcota bacterium]